MKMLNKQDYVKQAEEVIKNLPASKYGKFNLTTNQIRNILTLVNELYDMIRLDTSEDLNQDVQSHVQYIKMKIIYLAGREKAVKEFVEKSGITDYLDSVGKSRDNLMIVCHYMESLVAYHKFYNKE